MATLELYIIRHGDAAPRGEDYPDDARRPLTTKGIARMRKAARGLEALGVGFDQIVSSPLVRAKQTADILAGAMKAPIATSDALAPAGTLAAVLEELGRHMRKARIALVGHEPNVGELAAQLIGGRVPLVFGKGGACRIDFEVFPPKGAGALQWLATPRMLRRLGR